MGRSMQRNDWDLPEPPGVPRVRGPRIFAWVATILVAAIVVGAAFFIPLPMFYAYRPGPVRDIDRLIVVSNAKTYSSEGRLYMTTVNLDPDVTVAEWVEAMFSPSVDIVNRESVTGDGSLREQIRQQRVEMRTSQRHAREVAFAALGLGGATGDGARVVRTIPGYPADKVLKKDDVIVAVDGRRVHTTCEVGMAIKRHEVGETVRITARQDDGRRTLEVKTVQGPPPFDPGAPFVGIAMDDINYRLEADVDARFKTGQIAGPSAGLMMSLALYDRLTPEDLTMGRAIAGTGTIECDGEVGAIGGITQKVAAAENEGAEIFIAPQDNASQARAVADEIRIIAVGSFDEALEFLEGLN
jgi:PDZ domain-containing protein